ncbi:MAG: hypothetical protein M0021_08785 [Clostridia bacterium]|nr:hypothetical protein [Clostridia bacterium]
MEKILKQILAKLDGLESDVKGLKPQVEEIYSLKPKIEESHEWLGALYEANRHHKAEIDRLDHKVATVEGVLNGMANSLEPIKKAQ